MHGRPIRYARGCLVDVRKSRITHIYSIKHIINADGTMPWVEFFEIKSTGDVTRVANFSTLSTLPVCVDSTFFHHNEILWTMLQPQPVALMECIYTHG